jgi:uncharacterized protein YehS (DUF1456 family)
MINNDTLRRLCTILGFDNDKTLTVFSLGQCEITAEKLTHFFEEKDEATYIELLDVELASFLNGLIIEKRGKKDGPQHQAEQVINNNLIFNKVKIALELKADDVLATLELAEITLSKHELSAFFRKANHKHYHECSDLVLSAFLKGLKTQSQK